MAARRPIGVLQPKNRASERLRLLPRREYRGRGLDASTIKTGLGAQLLVVMRLHHGGGD
jgi:hypothetical protein